MPKAGGGPILVVGADSLIGGTLAGFLEGAGEAVIGTTRRNEKVGESNLYLDLSEEPDSWEIPVSPSVALLCASVTSMRACREDPEGSAKVNISGTVALAERLVSGGTFVVFLSTNQVFDGSLPMRSADDAHCPATEYGRQKAEAEKSILSQGDSAAVLRLTKVLHASDPLMSSWAQTLRSGGEIQPFSDMVFSPIPLSCALSVICLVAKHRVPGITQISGESDITYEDAAYIGADEMGTETKLVRPIESSRSGKPIEHVARHTTLDTSRVKVMFGLTAPTVEWTVRSVFREILTKHGV